MSWYIDIKTDRTIEENDIQHIVDNLPEYLCPIRFKKQDWGWPCVVDVFLPKANSITIHGAYGMDHKTMFEYLIIHLCKCGYKIVSIDESF